jgi:Beta-propeller repeat
LIFSTFLGGSGGSVAYPEAAMGIALDAAGNAYVTGATSSTNFPLLHAS